MPDGFPRRGEIYWVNFDPARGSEQAGKRPAVVVSNNHNNEHSPVVIVAALTTRVSTKAYPMNVQLDPGSTALEEPSEIRCGQLMTVSKERLEHSVATLSEEDVRRLDRALAKSLALPIPATGE